MTPGDRDATSRETARGARGEGKARAKAFAGGVRGMSARQLRLHRGDDDFLCAREAAVGEGEDADEDEDEDEESSEEERPCLLYTSPSPRD